MKDRLNLESFIKENRPKFDSERPSLKVWANIERGLIRDRRKLRSRKFVWRSVAASLLLLIGVGLGLMIYPRILERQALQAIHESTELNEMEIFFGQEVNVRLAALSTETMDEEIMTSLRETDREIKKLKLDIIYAPKSSREEILAAIIAAYETKIYILQTALERVSPTNNNGNEPNIL